MARIKITFPEKFLYETETDIRISDINYGDHLGNDSVLSLAHEARLRFLKSLGYTEKNIEGKGIIMTDAAIVYKSEGYHGDNLKIRIAADDINTLGFDLIYKLIRVSDNKEIALVKTGIVFFDYERKKITSIPPDFAKKLINE